MKKIASILGLLLIAHVALWAGDGDYAISRIPLKLLKNANAVIRLEEEHVVLKNLERMVTEHHFVITVLNEKGEKFADVSESYDAFNTIESIEGTLYDANGKKIKSSKKGDIQDVSISSDMNLAMDGRLKVHSFYYKYYPYTVEYTIKKAKKETMFFPQWKPVPDELISVEKSIISISVPADYKLRYKAFNYNSEPVIKEVDKSKEYTWAVSGFEAIVKEYASPAWNTITPVVLMAPSEFIIEDYQGSMTDWKSLGLFQASLNKGRDVLPESVRQKVHDIIKDAGTTKEKVDRLYKYMQQNTRYVSIQLGVGGWRPFEASYVAAKAYGDCKALSNFMYSLLKEAGVQSYYTLVRAGRNAEDIVVDFPSRQFNHVIVCVPDGKDTIWLECTSQTMTAGYMGDFTSNRHALAITEEGGKLLQTPIYGIKDNEQIRNIKAVLNENGTLDINASTRYTGLQQDDIHGMIHQLSKDRIKEVLHEQLDFATYDINKFDYREEKTDMPAIDESLDITVSNYATITGKRLFIVPNVMTRTARKLNPDSTRKYDIRLGFEYKDVDTVEIELPKGFEPEALPADVAIDSKFGKYNSSVKLKDNKIYYYRTIAHNSGSFPASDYGELVKFYDAIYKADRSRVVLVRKEQSAAPKAF